MKMSREFLTDTINRLLEENIKLIFENQALKGENRAFREIQNENIMRKCAKANQEMKLFIEDKFDDYERRHAFDGH